MKTTNNNLNNHANQLNPNHDAFWQSRGYDKRPDNWQDLLKEMDNYKYTKDDLDNHANQLNPNNDTYWQSRGFNERPKDRDLDDDYDDFFFV